MTAPTAPRHITRDEFQTISRLLREQTGIRLVPGKENLVMARLHGRLRQLGLHTYAEYFELLAEPGSGEEVGRAIDLLTTNETSFFRQPQHFDFLREVIVPARRADRPFRLWSAASSTGEEAYSSAMVLAESLADRPWEVLGSDVSSSVVGIAQRGIYPIAAASDIPGYLLRKYCRKGRDEYEGTMAVDRQLRSRVAFVHANLLDNLQHFGRFDVIMLRNVMIYFGSETKDALIERIQAMLHPGGYLIVSLSETINGIPCRLRSVGPSVYQLPEARDA